VYSFASTVYAFPKKLSDSLFLGVNISIANLTLNITGRASHTAGASGIA
jgi:hypothetical protein